MDYVTLWDRLSSMELQDDREDRWTWYGRQILGGYGIQTTSPWQCAHARSSKNLEELGVAKGEVLHLARYQAPYLDSGSRPPTWTRSMKYLLALRPGIEDETCDHILASCSYAKKVWWVVLSELNC
jgi:hypothetical protein